MKRIHRSQRMCFQQRNHRGENLRCDLADIDIRQIGHRVTLQLSISRPGKFLLAHEAAQCRGELRKADDADEKLREYRANQQF